MLKIGLPKFLIFALLIIFFHRSSAQCVSDESNVIDFELDGINYEIVKEKLNWVDAAACAVERGGFLVEISDNDEQNGLFDQLQDSDIDLAMTIAPDGGGASYVWTGGNDREMEGTWLWDGDNDGQGIQFWLGDANGNPVDNQFTNWGNEPDNYSNQDALGLALTNWPLGSAGQWNDIREINQLYYVIEYPDQSSNNQEITSIELTVYPNPARSEVRVELPLMNKDSQVKIMDTQGKIIVSKTISSHMQNRVTLEDISAGIYFLICRNGDATTVKKLVID